MTEAVYQGVQEPMSHPIRYSLADEHLGRIHQQEDGHLVMYSDYAALQAENERLRSVAQDNKAETEATRLQNERLRKAGDDVCEEYSFMLVQNIYPPSTKAIRAWRAATKGVQP